jgi:thiol-disulfide isomerase/thioredoxin
MKQIIHMITLLVIVFTVLGCNQNSKAQTAESGNSNIDEKKSVNNKKYGIEKGNYVIDSDITNLMGVKEKISDYEGKVVFLNFWATWCPPCRYEMPSMEEFNKKSKENNFVILAVSVDRDKTSKVSQFISTNGYTFPVYHDPSGKISEKFLITSIPQTFVINEEGVIVDKITGAFDWKTIDLNKYKKKGD